MEDSPEVKTLMAERRLRRLAGKFGVSPRLVTVANPLVRLSRQVEAGTGNGALQPPPVGGVRRPSRGRRPSITPILARESGTVGKRMFTPAMSRSQQQA